MSTIQKFEVLFILGGPGAGKGTICRYIANEHGYEHLSAGDLLRDERAKPGSKYGDLIENHITNGTIVPVAITCRLLEQAMQTSNNPSKRFLIDGFPRNQDNVDGWNEEMRDKCIVKGVLLCECSEEVCTKRCLNRGAAGSGRIDDNEDVLVKRHKSYYASTLPIIEHFGKLNLLYKVNSMQEPKDVYKDTKVILSNIGWL